MTIEETPIKKKKKRKLNGWILALIVIILAAGTFFFVQQRARKAAALKEVNLQTVPYQKETLVNTISGAGTVRAKQSASLTWQASGFVGKTSLVPGAPVKADEVLLQLDSNRLPADLLQAELNKTNAQAKLNNLDADTALQRATLQNNISTTEAAIKKLQEQKQALTLRACTQDRLKNLQDGYDNALKSYETYPSQMRWSMVETAKQSLAYCDPDTIAKDIQSLDSQISLQEETLKTHQANLTKIQNGPDPETKSNLELQVALAEKQLNNKAIRAPFAGTVTAVNSHEGDAVSLGSPAIQVSDLSELYVDVPVSEVDINTIKVGQNAELVFDAFFEHPYQGKVVEIAMVPNAATGVVNYTVTIAIEKPGDKIKPGMTAGVSILTEKRENVFAVPSEAVQKRGEESFLYVQRNGMPVQVKVQTGAYSGQKVEIVSGDIKEGEAIYLSPPVVDMRFIMSDGE